MRLFLLRNLGSIIALRFSPSFLGKGLGLCLGALLIGHSSPTFALVGDDTKFTLNALPSFKTVPADKKAIYQTAQAQGYCSDVLEIEQEGLVQSRPEFNNRFSVGTVRNKAEQTALEIYALGYRRCQALKHLSRVLAIPKLKAGIAPYAPKKPSLSSKIKNKDMRFTLFAPKPRLGIFFQPNSAALNQLIEDRSRPKGLDRPIDWARSQMPLDEEILLHTAFTDLVILSICHSYPEAYKDLGKFYDVQFAVIDPFINYGLFRQAVYLGIDSQEMEARLAEVALSLPSEVVKNLDEHSKQNKLHKHPQLARLFKLCHSY